MKILIVYYSLYGHVFKLAQAVKEGAESVKGAEVLFRRVEEFDIVLKKTADDKYLSQVREQQKDIPVCTLDDLRAADGVLIGSPTRYGNMTAQMKQLIDSTASLWLKGEMEGKPAGVFTSTASTHGGQETTLVTMMIPLLHLGMLIVGVPYSVEGMLHTEGARRHTVWCHDNCRRTGRVAAKTGGPRHCTGIGPASGRDHGKSPWLISSNPPLRSISLVSILVSVFWRLVFDRRQALGV